MPAMFAAQRTSICFAIPTTLRKASDSKPFPGIITRRYSVAVLDPIIDQPAPA